MAFYSQQKTLITIAVIVACITRPSYALIPALNTTQALVWTADGDFYNQATNGIMYLARGDPVDYVPKGTFKYNRLTGVKFSHIACDFSKSTIYFSRSSKRVIQALHVHPFTTETKTIPTFRTSGNIGGLAYDWIAKNLYLVDRGYRWITVRSTRSQNLRERTLTVPPLLQDPTGIAVSPLNGWLFWIELGTSPQIQRATLAGEDKNTIVTGTDIAKPMSMVVDEEEKMIYWTDPGRNKIGRSDFAGQNRYFFQASAGIYDIALYKTMLFTTDRGDNRIRVYQKSNGTFIINFRPTGMHGISDIMMYDRSRQPTPTSTPPCTNKGCSDICVNVGSSGQCLCRDGYRLASDGRNCYAGKPVEKYFVMYTDTGRNQIVQFNPSTNTTYALQLPILSNPVAVDFDYVEKRVYWTDVNTKHILRASMIGSDIQVIKRLPSASITDGLALDPISRLVYYTDTGFDTISAMTLDGSHVKTLINSGLDQPRTIVLDPLKGYMYWTDWGSYPNIACAKTDGTNKKILISTSLTWPNGLTIDHTDNRLYWCDTSIIYGSKIETSSLDGSNRRVLLNLPGAHFYGVAILNADLFYTDWKQQFLHKCNKTDGTKCVTLLNATTLRANDIIAVERGITGTNACSTSNGGCSHFCFATGTNSRSCGCPDGLTLLSDKRNCTSSKLCTGTVANGALETSCTRQVGTVCSFSCNSGHESVLSERKVNCTQSGKWSTSLSSLCKRTVILCPGTIPNGTLDKNCTRQIGSECLFSCNHGHKSVLSEPKIICTESGSWSKDLSTLCKPPQAPIVKNCSKDMTIELPSGKATVNVTWPQPRFFNLPGTSIHVITKYQQPKATFGPGSHVVEYTARGASGNSVTCRFTILVKDTEAPTVSDCLSPQRVVSTTNPGVVTWKLPTFTDNVDVISIEANMKPLTPLRWGNYTIKYLAKDAADNEATCDIQLLIVGGVCQALGNPSNGQKRCRMEGLEEVCKMTCFTGFFFFPRLKGDPLYRCLAGATAWKPNSQSPQCVSSSNSNVKLNGEITFPSLNDNCQDENIAVEIKRGVIDILKNKGFRKQWEDVIKERHLKVTNIRCPLNKATKRETAKDTTLRNLQVGFQIQVNSNDTSTFDKINECGQNLQTAVRNGKVSLSIKGQNIRATRVRLDQVSVTCEQGEQVYNGICATCPAGSALRGLECKVCPIGTYQDKERQTVCKPCSQGTTTLHKGALSSDECKGFCQPGTYSFDGYTPCHDCGKDEFSDLSSTKCSICPSTRETLTSGSSADKQCFGEKTDSKPSIGFIAGVCCGALLLIIHVITVTALCCFKRKKSANQSQDQNTRNPNPYLDPNDYDDIANINETTSYDNSRASGVYCTIQDMSPPNYDAPSGGEYADYFTHLDPASAQARYLKTTGAGYANPHKIQQQVTNTSPPEYSRLDLNKVIPTASITPLRNKAADDGP